jgi:hypothetical protein
VPPSTPHIGVDGGVVPSTHFGAPPSPPPVMAICTLAVAPNDLSVMVAPLVDSVHEALAVVRGAWM